jgi:hypothetical protein
LTCPSRHLSVSFAELIISLHCSFWNLSPSCKGDATFIIRTAFLLKINTRCIDAFSGADRRKGGQFDVTGQSNSKKEGSRHHGVPYESYKVPAIKEKEFAVRNIYLYVRPGRIRLCESWRSKQLKDLALYFFVIRANSYTELVMVFNSVNEKENQLLTLMCIESETRRMGKDGWVASRVGIIPSRGVSGYVDTLAATSRREVGHLDMVGLR